MSLYYDRQGYDSASQYNALKAQLERETQALRLQRRHIDGAVERDEHYSHRESEGSPKFVQPVDRTALMVRKVQQVISLCKQQNSLSPQEMQEVIKIENDILNYLQKNQQGSSKINPSQKSEKHPSGKKQIPQQTSSKQNLSLRQRVQQNSKIALSDDILQMIQEIQRKALSQIAHLLKEKNIIEKEKNLIEKERNALEQENRKIREEFSILESQKNQAKGRHSQGRGFSQEPNYAAEQRLLEENYLYEQNRLLEQNRMLSQQNYELRKRIDRSQSNLFDQNSLLQEHRLISEQNYELKKRLDRTSQGLGLQSQQYKSQIIVYETELRKAGQIIRMLQQKVNLYPQIQMLYDQGDLIRKDTVHLIKLKESRADHGQGQEQGDLNYYKLRIRELEDQLNQEERAKQAFLNDLILFKQKYRDLEDENFQMKSSSRPETLINRSKTDTMVLRSPQKTVSVINSSRQNANILKPPPVKRSGLTQYEQTINQMRNFVGQ